MKRLHGLDKLIKMLGRYISYALAMIMTFTFFVAYIQPNKAILVTINTVGEANLEAVFIPLVWIVIIISEYLHLKESK